MAGNSFTKSTSFVLIVLALVVVLLPFGLEQIGEVVGFKFPATKWVKGLFVSKVEKVVLSGEKVDWDEQLKDLKNFSEWVDGQPDAKITVIRAERYQVVRADPNPATSTRFSWKLQSLSGSTDVNAAQIREKLMLICEPVDKVSGEIASVESLDGDEQGFKVTVSSVKGEGKMGLSYDGLPPIYYDVKLRRLWLVPVASCRSAMRGRYDSAVFFPGMDQGLPEGAVISPSSDKCGYRVLSISDYCVWFEAFYGDTPDEDILPHNIWPNFSRVDTLPPTPAPGRLIFGKNRCFWPGDAIKLPNSGSYLMVDGFLAGRAVVFRLLDASMRPVRELLCVIVRER